MTFMFGNKKTKKDDLNQSAMNGQEIFFDPVEGSTVEEKKDSAKKNTTKKTLNLRTKSVSSEMIWLTTKIRRQNLKNSKNL